MDYLDSLAGYRSLQALSVGVETGLAQVRPGSSKTLATGLPEVCLAPGLTEICPAWLRLSAAAS